MWFEQGDSMVLDGSFGRTQRISQSEVGKPHSMVCFSFTSSIGSEWSFHSLPLGLFIKCMSATDNVTYANILFVFSLHKRALQAPGQ
jgi:hypothetical protein